MAKGNSTVVFMALLAAMPIGAFAQVAHTTGPKVKVFTPSLGDSWIKTIPACSPDIVMAPDGKTFAMNGYEQAVRVLNSETGDDVCKINLRGGSSVKAVAFSPDGANLATVRSYSQRTEVQVWNPVDGKPVWRQVIGQRFPERIGFCSNDRLVAYAVAGVHEWSLKTRELTFQEVHRGMRDVHFGTISNLIRDGARLEFATVGVQSRLGIHDLATHQEVRRLDLEGLPLDFHITSIALSPLGDSIAIVATKSYQSAASRVSARPVSPMHYVGLWDARTGKLIWSRQPERNYPLKAAFSPDGRYLATAGMQLRMAAPEEPDDLPYGWGGNGYFARNGRVVWLSWNPHFRASHNAILFWDAATGAIKKAILHPEYNITGITFATDGAALLVSGSENPESPRRTSGIVARLSLSGAFEED